MVSPQKYAESFKFRALSAGAVMAFDGQTEVHFFPSNQQGQYADDELVVSKFLKRKIIVKA